MRSLRLLLSGGDRRSIGAANELVATFLAEPGNLDEIVALMGDPDALIAMRAADVAEKVCAARPELFAAHTSALVALAARATQKEVRWHLAQMLPRLALDDRNFDEVSDILLGYLNDKSRIVQTFALQALADLARTDPVLREKFTQRLISALTDGSPAVKARARKLLQAVEPERR